MIFKKRFEPGDYCLWCKDIQTAMPSVFTPCIVTGYDEKIKAILVKELENNESIAVRKENLIFIKELSKFNTELMYNSPSKKGGSYNVTSHDGTRLKASFYFDNDEEKLMAERAASIFNESYGIF